MKIKLIVIVLFLMSFYQSVDAQDFSAFYQLSNSENYSYDKKIGYQLNNTSTISFSPLSQETLDIRLEASVEKQYEDDTKFNISFGNGENLSFSIPFGDNRRFMTIKGKENIAYYHIGYDENQKKAMVSRSIILRVSKNKVRMVVDGEIGGVFMDSKEYLIKDRKINIKVVSGGKIIVKPEIETAFLPKLSSFAKNGLKLHKSADLKSASIATIPYGGKVIVISDLKRSYTYEEERVDTRGNIKFDGLSSKMLKVMYNNKIGYAYGGYLLPFYRIKPSDNQVFNNFEGWTSRDMSEEVYYQNELVLKKGMIYFNSDIMDATQHKLLASTLFPKVLSINKINTLLQTNKKHVLKATSGNFEEHYEVVVAQNQLKSLEYTKLRNGTLDVLTSNKTAYVVASKLNMRTSNDPKSEVITKIPLAASVSIIGSTKSPFLVLGGVRGKMIKIQYNNQEGYVFDAYLSAMKPPSGLHNQDYPRSFMSALDKNKSKWKHSSIDVEDYELYGGIPWMVIPSRDKFQAIKTLRILFPELDKLSFKWNAAKNDYDITSPTKTIDISVSGNRWNIDIYEDEEQMSGISIIIETITDNLQKVTVDYISIGC